MLAKWAKARASRGVRSQIALLCSFRIALVDRLQLRAAQFKCITSLLGLSTLPLPSYSSSRAFRSFNLPLALRMAPPALKIKVCILGQKGRAEASFGAATRLAAFLQTSSPSARGALSQVICRLRPHLNSEFEGDKVISMANSTVTAVDPSRERLSTSPSPRKPRSARARFVCSAELSPKVA